MLIQHLTIHGGNSWQRQLCHMIQKTKMTPIFYQIKVMDSKNEPADNPRLALVEVKPFFGTPVGQTKKMKNWSVPKFDHLFKPFASNSLLRWRMICSKVRNLPFCISFYKGPYIDHISRLFASASSPLSFSSGLLDRQTRLSSSSIRHIKNFKTLSFKCGL